MDNDLISFLKSTKIFASADLEHSVYEALLGQFEEVYLPEDQTLFREGEPSTDFYILVSGKLSANLTLGRTRVKRVGYLLPGETVGEVGVIVDDVRALTIKAVEPSILLKMANDTFKKLCRQYPAILFNAVQPVANRSQQIIRMLSSGETKKHIAILPADESIDAKKFAEQIKKVLRNYKKVSFLSETDIDSDHLSQESDLDSLIKEAEDNNHVILYLLKTYETPLSRRCWRKIGKMFIVARGNSDPHVCPFVLEKLRDSKSLVEVRRELVLIYKKNTFPENIQIWNNLHPFFLHHNIREDLIQDYQKLLRFMRGKAVGLVLSGGGVKGWSHMGVLQAMHEANIKVDAIGGTSVGAIVAALYAMFENYEDVFNEFANIIGTTRNTVSFRRLCWPAVSLFDCKEFTLILQKVFDLMRIEHLWMHYFCISTNLATHKETIHRTGFIWEKIRASVSIPGIVPPMVINGELHVDGGLVNNLPINVMRELLGPESRILGVELISMRDEEQKYCFPPTLTFKQAFLSKLGLGYHDYRFPAFIDTFLKSLLVGSSLRQQENRDLADVLVTLNTQDFSMLNLKRNAQQLLFDMGYQAAKEKIAEWEARKK